jgi:hypothetical protein
MARSALIALSSPDELQELAQTHLARAAQTKRGSERLRLLTFAGALIDQAEIKKLLQRYERRVLN